MRVSRVVLLALAVAAACLPAPAGGQEDASGICLDIEPERAPGRTDSPTYLLATLRRKVSGETACNGKMVEKGYGHLVDFEVTGAGDLEGAGLGADTPESPDATCEIEPASYTDAHCIVALWGDEKGVATVRAWIDADRADPPDGVVEADRTEGADKSVAPGNGCVDGEGAGGQEPDCTDVVEIDWRTRPPCEPERDPADRFDRIVMYRSGDDVTPGMYTTDHRGRSPRRLGDPPEDLREFLWSPDHRNLAITAGYVNSLELSVMRADGTGRVELTDDFMLDEGAAWSPDSRRIVFASHNYRRSTPMQLKVVSASGGRAKWITRGKFDSTHPDWSPDGERIVYARYRIGSPIVGSIEMIEPDGGNRRTLVSAKALFEYPQFSPDGRKVLYRKYLDEADARDLFVVGSRGGRAKRLTRHPRGVVSDFQWSPDGRKIAYETTGYSGWTELRVMNADGSRNRRIVRHFGLGVTLSPSWSPDSSLVVYQLPYRPYDPDVSRLLSDVWVAAADGSCAQAITPTPDVTETGPAWTTPASSSNPYEF